MRTATPWPTFAQLKATLTIEQVLAHRSLLTGLRRQGDRLVGACPIHRGEAPNSFTVNLVKNLWYCFSDCGGGGDLIDFVRRLDRCSHAEAGRYLATLAPSVKPAPIPAPRPAASSASRSPPAARRAFTPFVRSLPLDHATPWLDRKGIRAETARLFEVGRYHGPGFLHGCIGVRLHDPDGRPLGYAGRRLHPAEVETRGKWKFPPGFPASQVLYGFHRARPYLHRGLTVVECPWGVLRLAQVGIPAVALLGTRLSPDKKRLLATAPRLILMLDGDPPGRAAARDLQRSFGVENTSLVSLPEGHDPDDLTDAQLLALTASFLS